MAASVLVGTDACSIAPYEDAVCPTRSCLWRGADFRGLDLSGVPDGNYILAAFPLKLEGVEAAPVPGGFIGRIKNSFLQAFCDGKRLPRR